jgi:hypothetical protein
LITTFEKAIHIGTAHPRAQRLADLSEPLAGALVEADLRALLIVEFFVEV